MQRFPSAPHCPQCLARRLLMATPAARIYTSPAARSTQYKKALPMEVSSMPDGPPTGELLYFMEGIPLLPELSGSHCLIFVRNQFSDFRPFFFARTIHAASAARDAMESTAQAAGFFSSPVATRLAPRTAGAAGAGLESPST